MSIEIIKPGIYTSLQGGEVAGYRAIGIGPGGAMDAFAAACANRMAQNPAGEPVIEMHFPAPELLFHTGALIALAGGDFDAENNGTPLKNWQTHFIAANTSVRFNKIKTGYRAYLSVHGGFKPGSSSFPQPTKPLQKGNRIHLQKKTGLLPGTYESAVSPGLCQLVYNNNDGCLHCIAGPEWEQLSTPSQQRLLSSVFTISSQSNRMGYRLQGTPVDHRHTTMLSSAADCGTVQLLPGGLPVILMAAHQTTGGYPRILSVISPSRAWLSQAAPGTCVRFSIISLQEASEKLISWRQLTNLL